MKTFGDQIHQLRQELGCTTVTLVGDRGMIKGDQKAAAQAAGFHFITALTKPQIERLLKENVFQLELFEEKVGEVISEAGGRYVLRRNPVRQQEMAHHREQKRQVLEAAVRKANQYLTQHRRAKTRTQRAKLSAQMKRLGVAGWLTLEATRRRLSLRMDEPALQQAARLDGCYVIETDLKPAQAQTQTVHDRYKDLAYVERDFRTLKSGHLEFRPWFVCTQENTQAHALTAMLALKVRRHLERAWEKLNLTVEEGLQELEKLCVMELVHGSEQEVVARQVPVPNALQKELLDALGLTLPAKLPEAKVVVGTRKKIQNERKGLAK